MKPALGHRISRHGFSQWVLWFLLGPFVALAANHARERMVAQTLSYPGERAVAILILLVVLGAALALQVVLGRKAVSLHEDGVASADVAIRWDEVAFYRFSRVTRSHEAALGDAVSDPVLLALGTRFSSSGGGDLMNATVMAADGRSVSVNSGFAGSRRFCEAVVDRVDPRLVPRLRSRIESGEPVEFGELVLQGGGLRVPEVGLVPFAKLSRFRVLDGQVWLTADGKALRYPGVPNAYALEKLLAPHLSRAAG